MRTDGERSVGYMSRGVKRWAALLALCASVGGCCECLDGFAGPTADVPPDKLFRAIVVDPMPTDIAHLESSGDLWQGYSLWFRFEAPEDETAHLAGHEEVPCDAAFVRQFQLPNRSYDTFSPPFGDTFTDAKRCWLANGIENAWTGQGTSRVALGVDGRWYIRAIGQ